MINSQGNEAKSLKDALRFLSGKDGNGSNKYDTSTYTKASFINETMCNISNEMKKNEERLNRIRIRSALANLSNDCQLGKVPNSKGIITTKLISDPLSYNVHESDADAKDEDFSKIESKIQTSSIKKSVSVQFATCSSIECDLENDSDSKDDDSNETEPTVKTSSLTESASGPFTPDSSIEYDLELLVSTSTDDDEDISECKQEEFVPTIHIESKSLHIKKLQHNAQATIYPSTNISLNKIPHHLRLGLTLSAIQKLSNKLALNAAKVCNDQIPANDDVMPKCPLNDRLNGYENWQCIVEWAKLDGLSVCERIRNDPDLAASVGEANVLVSWDTSTGIQTLADDLREFIDANGLPRDATFFWIRDYVVKHSNFMSDLKWLGDCVKAVGFTVLISSCNVLLPLERANCIQELYYTKMSNSKFNLIVSKKQQNDVESIMKYMNALVVNSVTSVNVAKAACWNIDEKKLILDDLKSKVSLGQCNKLVIELLQTELTNHGLKVLSKVTMLNRKVSTLVDNIILLLKKQGRFMEAKAILEEYLLKCNRINGPKDQESLASMFKLGNFLRERSDFINARYLLGKALDGRREFMGATHEDTLTSMATLGMLLSQLGMYDDAIPLYKEALAGRRILLGLEHPQTLTTINNLASLLYQRNLFDQALPLLEESVNRSYEVLGPKHPDTLCAIGNLAVQLRKQGHLAQAHIMYEEALTLKREVLGSEHPSTLRAIHNFAILSKEQGQYDKACILYKEAILGRKNVLGPNHPHTLNSIKCLEIILDSQDCCQAYT